MIGDSDVEHGEVESKIEKLDSDTSDESSTSDIISRPTTALTKESAVSATPPPGTYPQEAAEAVERGRTRSYDTDDGRSSSDSQRTLPDTHDVQVPAHRPRSRAQSSTRSVVRDAVKVPRSERRGLFARFAIIAEVSDPYDYSRKLKWLITFVVAVAAAAAPMGSSIILPGLSDITATFHTNDTIVNLSVALYMLSMSIFPLWWSSFSETLGRRTIYLTSFAMFLVFNILGAVSVNIGMFIAMRMLSGGAAASVQAVGAGTIADIWEVKERGTAMGIFYLGPLCGPLLSPILGGVLTQNLGWRSTQWFLSIFSAILCLMILFALPETLRQRKPIAAIAEAEAATEVAATSEKGRARPGLSRTTTRQSVQVKTRKYVVMLRRAFIDPLHIILYLRFAAVAITVYYSSITFGSLYILNISIQKTFAAPPYNYSTIIIGLLYIPNSVGYILASIFAGRWVDRIMHREARKAGRYDEKGKLVFRPMDRMKENAWLGAIMWPCAMIMYGWTANYGVNIAAPMIANFIFGIGSMIIFGLVTTMLTEFMPRKASNGVAVNNFCRNILSCVGVIVANPLINAIGDGWVFTIFGVVALISGPVTILAMKRYGERWRNSMDKGMEKQMGD